MNGYKDSRPVEPTCTRWRGVNQLSILFTSYIVCDHVSGHDPKGCSHASGHEPVSSAEDRGYVDVSEGADVPLMFVTIR